MFALGISGVVAIASATLAIRRWTRQRRKDRVDGYFEEVLAIRRGLATADGEERRALVARVRDAEERAFEQLIAEKLDANESFRIFVALCHDVVREIEARREGAPGPARPPHAAG